MSFSSSCAGTTTATRLPSSIARPAARGRRRCRPTGSRRLRRGRARSALRRRRVATAACGDPSGRRAGEDRRLLDLLRLELELARAELRVLGRREPELEHELVGRRQRSSSRAPVDRVDLLLVVRDLRAGSRDLLVRELRTTARSRLAGEPVRGAGGDRALLRLDADDTSGVWPFLTMFPEIGLRRDPAAEVARLRLALRPRPCRSRSRRARSADGARVRLRRLELDVAARRVRLAEVERRGRLDTLACRRARPHSRRRRRR